MKPTPNNSNNELLKAGATKVQELIFLFTGKKIMLILEALVQKDFQKQIFLYSLDNL